MDGDPAIKGAEELDNIIGDGGSGDGASIDKELIDAAATGLGALGLGVLLNDAPEDGFRSPAEDAKREAELKLDLGFKGTKTERPDIYDLFNKRNFYFSFIFIYLIYFFLFNFLESLINFNNFVIIIYFEI